MGNRYSGTVKILNSGQVWELKALVEITKFSVNIEDQPLGCSAWGASHQETWFEKLTRRMFSKTTLARNGHGL